MDNYSKVLVEAQQGPMRETLRRRLEQRREQAAEHLADVEEALKFLDDNSNFEAFHNLLSKTGF